MKTLGIVGLGQFGQLVARLAPPDMHILGFSPTQPHTPPNVTRCASLQELAHADVILLSVSLAALPKVLQQLAPHISPDTLLIDVCSVKLRPAEIFAKYLPNHQELLLTHPLFGPMSAAKSTKDFTLIVSQTNGQKPQKVLRYCEETLGLRLVHMTNDQHDQVMAKVHALTFFVARGLRDIDIQDMPVTTPSFEKLLSIEHLDRQETDALFATIQQGNPYAAQIRKDFIQKLHDIDAAL